MISSTRGVRFVAPCELISLLAANQFISFALVYSTSESIGYSLAARKTELHVSAILLVMTL